MITIHIKARRLFSMADFARVIGEAQFWQGVMRVNRRFNFKLRPGLN